MNISVAGSGRWGSFLAWYMSVIKQYNVIIYGRKDSANFKNLSVERKNSYVSLPDSVSFTSEISALTDFSDIILVSINSQNLRSLSALLNKENLAGKTIVLCMKGLETNTGLRLSEVVREEINQDINVAVWVGPGHTQDYVRNVPNCMLIDSDKEETTTRLIDLFASQLIRFYYGTDLIGNEIGAASKNVIGIAAGMLDGLNYSALKGALMARGTREIARLIKAMGGNEVTTYGLCHLGDYEATLFSDHSNNRNFGKSVVEGNPFTKTAEGFATVKAMKILSEKYDVELPITDAIYAITYEKQDPKETLNNLLMRSLSVEF